MNPINISLLVFMIGLYGVISKNNLIKKVMGLTIMNGSIVLFFISIGYREDGLAPILEKGVSDGIPSTILVDPLPQALMLTAIVIGISITALALALIVRIYAKYKTLDIQQLLKER
ncbi:MAG: cation:proton antiporter subunit C [Candidatus Atribacteria bacterium]|nr:cation:proton antiporter subunit C [Candidatus Atribacteria bacterium]